MYYIADLQASIEYIELHLREELTVADCARAAGYSVFHFCRIFQMTAGVSVMEYIRRRRLTQAAIEIAETNRGISEIGFDWGFNSHANFTRAFGRLFAVAPSAFRNTLSSLCLFHKVDLAHCRAGDEGFHVEPRLLHKPAFRLVGYQMHSRNPMDAPRFWNTYHAGRLGETLPSCPGPAERWDIGLSTDFERHKSRQTYIIGIEAQDDASVGGPMVSRLFPAADYAVFATPRADTYTFVNTIHRTWRYIFQKWLPASGFEHAGTHDFETYCEDSRTYSEDIYIPIVTSQG